MVIAMDESSGENKKEPEQPEQLSFFGGKRPEETEEDVETTETETLESEIPPEQSVALQELDLSEDDDLPQKTNTKPAKKLKSFDTLCKESVIIAFIIFIGGELTRILRSSFTAVIFTSYDKTAAYFRSSAIYGLFSGRKSTRIFSTVKKKIQRASTDALIPKAISTFLISLLKVRTRIYALILLAFGGVSLFIHYFINSYFTVFNYNIYSPIAGTAILIAGAFLLIPEGTLAHSIYDSRILNTLLTGMLGIKRASDSDGCIELSGSGACIVGALFGFLTLIIPPQEIVFFILFAIYSFIVIKSPEAGIISIFLMAPFASLKLIAAAIVILTVSYIFKALCGKRTFYLEFMDLFVALFILMFFLSETVTFGERRNILIPVMFTAVYFIAVSIMRSPVWFDRAIKALITVLSLLSVYGVITAVLENFIDIDIIINTNSITDLPGITGNALNSSAMLCQILLSFLFVLLCAFLTSKNKANRFGLLLINLAAIYYLFTHLPSGAWAAAVISFIVFMILYNGKSAVFLILATAILPFLPIFRIYSADHFFSALSYESSRVNIWNAVIRMIFDHSLSGIGGSNSFEYLYPSYFVGNTEHLPHTGSLLLQIALSLGIFGLILFVIIFLCILQSSFSFGRSCSDKSAFGRIICYAGMCGVLANFIWGIGEYIWYNPRAILVFWILTAITLSARRSSTVNTRSDYSYELSYEHSN